VGPRRRGRGRRPASEVREEALRAAGEILIRDGMTKFTIERVAAEAGVSKTTIYKWWPSKGALAFDGYFHATESTLQFPDTGDIADDLLTQLRGFVRLMTTTPAGGVISELVGLAQTDADLAIAMRDQYSHPRFQLAVDRLDEAKRVGQLRQDVDSESLVDQLWGACYHRLLLTGLPVTDTFVETLLGNLLAGIRPPPGRRRSSPSDSARRSAARAPVDAERLS
jgi:AcrR family transcriptional regulator